jgi:hypothetical protein
MVISASRASALSKGSAPAEVRPPPLYDRVAIAGLCANRSALRGLIPRRSWTRPPAVRRPVRARWPPRRPGADSPRRPLDRPSAVPAATDLRRYRTGTRHRRGCRARGRPFDVVDQQNHVTLRRLEDGAHLRLAAPHDSHVRVRRDDHEVAVTRVDRLILRDARQHEAEAKGRVERNIRPLLREF